MLKRLLVISIVALAAVIPAFNAQGMTLKTGKVQAELKKSSVKASSYKNYLNLPNEWVDYGIGDPYVFRENGNYYLYCSTKDGETGIKAWSSKDLVNWKYEGLVTKDPITELAYAPEVVYWNGYYYMYTSPGGNGHYALRSTSPIGPFKVVTKNFGQSIDGDVFIDDNGKWYFNHAGQNGIVQNPMTNPLTVDDGGGIVLDSTNMNGWTEGPGIIKRNGKYFITYTGNHVQSDGYRVNYSVSAEGPNSGYRAGENNPLIISTDEDYNGLGHSSTVLGPDMDSYYLIYHNRIGANASGAPSRKLNIARLVFNGDKMAVVGANTAPQPVPKTADFFTWVNNEGVSKNFNTIKTDNEEFLISKRTTDQNYIAEFNCHFADGKEIKVNPKLEFIFSYKDSKNYMSLSLNSLKKDIALNQIKDGKVQTIKTSGLFSGVDFTKLHTVRVEKTDNSLVISFDNLQKMSVSITHLTGGSIGYAYNKIVPVIGYTAFNNDSSGTSDYDVYKSVPGNIESTHFLKGYNVGYYLNQTSINGDINVNDSSLNHDKLATLDNGSYFMSLKQKGEYLKYNINVAEKAMYGVNIKVKGKAEDITVKLYVDDKPVCQSIIPSTNKDHIDKFVEMRFANVELDKGLHTLKIENAGGSLEFKNLSFYKVTEGNINFKDPLTKYLFKNWTQSGLWKANGDGFRSVDLDNSKGYTGNYGWTDYEVTTKVTVKEFKGTGEGGVIFRVNNESTGFRQQTTVDFTGYYVGIDKNGLFVDKLNYNRTRLATKKIKIDLNKEYELKVRAIGNNISVYLGDATNPLIEIHDDDVLSSGKVGLYSSDKEMYFKDFAVTNDGIETLDMTNTYSYNQIGIGANFSHSEVEAAEKQAEEQNKKKDVIEKVKAVSYNFEDGKTDLWKNYGGTWTIKDVQLCIGKDVSSKAVTGDESWKDYTIEADLKVGAAINSGVVFRVTEPGDGADAMKGYFAGFNNDGVILGKEDNNWTSIQFTPTPVKKNGVNHIKIEVVGNSIKVYAGDDLNKPKIDIKDDSFATGMVGVRSHFAELQVDNFVINNITK